MTWGATAAIFLPIVRLSSLGGPEPSAQAPGPAAAPGLAEVEALVQTRCAMCHAAAPLWPGLHRTPGGVRLEAAAEIAGQPRAFHLQAARSHAMPPGGRIWLDAEARALIAAWYRVGAVQSPG